MPDLDILFNNTNGLTIGNAIIVAERKEKEINNDPKTGSYEFVKESE
ncbi:MAG: hypothetical protein ACI837_003022 [Crocinitomicaceae bacterium]|jgi:hypothetical protein